jgi:hypothetical protein
MSCFLSKDAWEPIPAERADVAVEYVSSIGIAEYDVFMLPNDKAYPLTAEIIETQVNI